jgi:2,4'-dihydroxyacetophenone dioxygenase
MVTDAVIAGGLMLDGDERDWVPCYGMSARATTPTSCGCAPQGCLSRHRHCGPVHAFTPLRGTWRYLEHDWVASARDYAFEPPGETYTLVISDDVQEMATLFHVTGGYTYIDPYGVALGYEDVFTKLECAARRFAKVRAVTVVACSSDKATPAPL